VTAAMEVGMPESGYWTVDDLDDLPEDGIRRELIDGVLIVSPSPTNIHQTICGLLFGRLYDLCPPEFEVTQAVEVRISPTRSLTPDVLVTTSAAAGRRPHKFGPHEVVLAIEVVSPSSVSFDRVIKPSLYAQAGIASYWRIETRESISVNTHVLDPAAGAYRSTGVFAEIIEVDRPWRIRLPVKEITPRGFESAS
jgi:Uma2 family endonuclease